MRQASTKPARFERHRARTRRIRQRRRAVQNVYFFGDSLTDVGQLQVGPAAGHRTVHDQSGPGLGAGVRAALRLHRDPRDATGGNNYAYGGARVTQLAGRRRSAALAGRGRAGRDAGARNISPRVPPIRMRSTRSGAAATISSINSACCWPARQRRRRCRPHWARPPSSSRSRSRVAQGRGRALHHGLERARHRHDA